MIIRGIYFSNADHSNLLAIIDWVATVYRQIEASKTVDVDMKIQLVLVSSVKLRLIASETANVALLHSPGFGLAQPECGQWWS